MQKNMLALVLLSLIWKSQYVVSFLNVGGCRGRVCLAQQSAPTRSNLLLFAKRSTFSSDVAKGLDLPSLFEGISKYAATRRGQQAFLSLATDENAKKSFLQQLGSSATTTSRQRRVMQQQQSMSSNMFSTQREIQLIPMATSVQEAKLEYQLVEQAMLALDDDFAEISFPPFYTEGSPLERKDNTAPVDTDYDEWLQIPPQDVTLEHVLHAEQVMETLVQVHQWAQTEAVKNHAPGLSEIATRSIAVDKLLSTLSKIRGAVQIVRSLTTTSRISRNSKMAYMFRLDNQAFPELEALREREGILIENIDALMKKALRKIKGSPECVDHDGRKLILVPKAAASQYDFCQVRESSSEGGRCFIEPKALVDLNQELSSIRKELQETETALEQDLIHSILSVAPHLDESLHAMARLDTIFARAAFGINIRGVIPRVENEGVISVSQFIHPVLASKLDTQTILPSNNAAFQSTATDNAKVVPIDLQLCCKKDCRALLISGPNGGGKTLAMKSFGIAAIAVKMAIPIGTANKDEEEVRVDFFNDVTVQLGDPQSVQEGESTFMAKINEYSTLLQKTRRTEMRPQPSKTKSSSPSLVLIDEIGGNTDPLSGGLIGQAILEKLLETPQCHLVATTHSPHLKAMSFHNDKYDCASVLLTRRDNDDDDDDNNEVKRPSFQLQYGIIGDSYALGALFRANPPLPADVVERAAHLLAGSSSSEKKQEKEYSRAIMKSLETQLEIATKHCREAERAMVEAQQRRDAILTMSRAHEERLGRLETKLCNLHNDLKADDEGTLELVGNSLETLKAVKKKVATQNDLLKERGLRPVPASHVFTPGEIVIITAQGPWEGSEGTVVLDTNNDDDDQINVVMSGFSAWDEIFFAGNDPTMQGKPMRFQRSELAIWDYDSVWGSSSSDPMRVETRRRKRSTRVAGKDESSSPSAGKDDDEEQSVGASPSKKAKKKKRRRR